MAGTSLTLFWLAAPMTTANSRGCGTPRSTPPPIAAARSPPPHAPSTAIRRRGRRDPGRRRASRAAAVTVRAALEMIVRDDRHARERARAASTRSPVTATTASACSAGPRSTVRRLGGAGCLEPGAATTLERAAETRGRDRAGGTSGALWGVIPRASPSAPANHGDPSAAERRRRVAAGVAGVRAYGKAEVGDKTMVDALVPFTTALTRSVDAAPHWWTRGGTPPTRRPGPGIHVPSSSPAWAVRVVRTRRRASASRTRRALRSRSS